MSNYALRVPDSLFEYAKELAQKENCSLNQLIVTALAEKVSAIRTEEFFRERIARARHSRRTLEELLDLAPAKPPLPGDELPSGLKPAPIAQVREPVARHSAKRSKAKKLGTARRGKARTA
ncbi:MAG: toxin-antitoxin system HicB family antitoxin [Steroidobacterales bacterium]